MEGQPPDFTRLVDRYGRRVFNLAFRITGSRQDAEDVVQDTFLQVARGLPEFRGESDLFTWICRIALHASLKVRRKFGSEASIDALEEKIETFREEVPHDVRQWIQDPAKAVYRRALLSEINQGCLHFMTFRLTDEQRVVYVMRAILDFTCQEIAAVLEVPQSVVKSRLHRAHAKLEKYFGTRCQWCDPDHATCSCESRVGFALFLDPEILRRVRMQALKTENEAVFLGYVARQVESISELYRRLPQLEYKVETVKSCLAEAAKKSSTDP
jgi:RNA polymerase sigma-70 factor, ECF subfamily